MGTILLGQDVSNALPGPVVRNILLNTTWVAGFRAREDAQIFWPHVVHDPADRRTESARRAAFFRDVAGMARQHYLLLVKGEPTLPVRAPDVADPAVLAGVSDDELLDIFNREIAVRSMLPNATALKLIEAWEADVVERTVVPPVTASKKAKGTIKSIVDLKKFLMPTEEEE